MNVPDIWGVSGTFGGHLSTTQGHCPRHKNYSLKWHVSSFHICPLVSYVRKSLNFFPPPAPCPRHPTPLSHCPNASPTMPNTHAHCAQQWAHTFSNSLNSPSIDLILFLLCSYLSLYLIKLINNIKFIVKFFQNDPETSQKKLYSSQFFFNSLHYFFIF